MNGRKVWISNAQNADRILLLTRTAPRRPERPFDGMTLFLTRLKGKTGVAINRIDKIMRNAVEQPVSIRRIAEDVGVSTRQLERIFVKHLNTSPKKFMLDLRLERARYLLLQTEMSVIDVAIATGFESPSHFARVYRTAFGMPPNRQRNRMT